jgi:geranylgeranyl pyrophosphate synthase
MTRWARRRDIFTVATGGGVKAWMDVAATSSASIRPRPHMILSLSSRSIIISMLLPPAARRRGPEQRFLDQHQQQQQQQSQLRYYHRTCHPLRQNSSVLTSTASGIITGRLKSHVLDRAVRHDSPLWQQQPPPPPPQPPRLNGDDHDQGVGSVGIGGGDIDMDDDNDETEGGDVDEPTSTAHLWDPLDDLDVSDRATRYWPHLPRGIGMAHHQPNHTHHGHHQHANGTSSISSTIDPFVLCADELSTLSDSIRNDLLGTDHPVLHQAASYFFKADDANATGGKKFRPLLVHLMAKALAQAAAVTTADGQQHRDDDNNDVGHSYGANTTITTSTTTSLHKTRQRRIARLAEIAELIHTASLFHDDVIDQADTRRGVPAVHRVFGDKMAILAGDYLLARASMALARLRNVAVVETMSTIIEHLVRGEVMQMKGSVSSSSDNNNHHNNNDTTTTSKNPRLDYYLRKNFYKTGSLMAHSCKSAALLMGGGSSSRNNSNNNFDPAWIDIAYRYGKHVGMAFQLVDDILDYEGTLSHMGKAALSDLNSGVATAPVLFAAEEYPDLLWPMIDRKFRNDGDVEQALSLVHASAGMDRTRHLARVHAEIAMDAILELTPDETDPRRTLYRDSMVQLAYKVVARTK